VTGHINQELVYALTPQILRLLHESRDPISVYINSPGGVVANATEILRLLQNPGMDSASACRIITIVTSLAASSAAILLTHGDYAIAYPKSIIHFHGVRSYRQRPITAKKQRMSHGT